MHKSLSQCGITVGLDNRRVSNVAEVCVAAASRDGGVVTRGDYNKLN